MKRHPHFLATGDSANLETSSLTLALLSILMAGLIVGFAAFATYHILKFLLT